MKLTLLIWLSTTIVISMVSGGTLVKERVLEKQAARVKFIDETLKFYREALEDLKMIRTELLEFTVESVEEEEGDVLEFLKAAEEDNLMEQTNDVNSIGRNYIF